MKFFVAVLFVHATSCEMMIARVNVIRFFSIFCTSAILLPFQFGAGALGKDSAVNEACNAFFLVFFLYPGCSEKYSNYLEEKGF